MRWKGFVSVILPLAAFIGTWIGLAAGGAPFSSGQLAVLTLFALWIIVGFGVYTLTERVKMNRPRSYR